MMERGLSRLQRAENSLVLVDAPDFSAVERGLTTLAEFPSAPYWDMAKINCPEAQCDLSLIHI